VIAVLLVIPVILSAFIVRSRTVADRESVTVSHASWQPERSRGTDIEGAALRQELMGIRKPSGQAPELQLPAVTFATVCAALTRGQRRASVPNTLQ